MSCGLPFKSTIAVSLVILHVTVNGSGGGVILIHEGNSNSTVHLCKFTSNTVIRSEVVFTASSFYQ